MSVSRGSRPDSNVSFYSNSTTPRFGLKHEGFSSIILVAVRCPRSDRTARRRRGRSHPRSSSRTFRFNTASPMRRGILYRGAVMVGEGLEDTVPQADKGTDVTVELNFDRNVGPAPYELGPRRGRPGSQRLSPAT